MKYNYKEPSLVRPHSVCVFARRKTNTHTHKMLLQRETPWSFQALLTECTFPWCRVSDDIISTLSLCWKQVKKKKKRKKNNTAVHFLMAADMKSFDAEEKRQRLKLGVFKKQMMRNEECDEASGEAFLKEPSLRNVPTFLCWGR